VKLVVAVIKPNKKQKAELYGQMLNVTDIEAFDKKAFADARGINYSSLGGMIGQMITQPRTYLELGKKGFTDVQIPKWVKRPEAGVEVVPVLKPLPGPTPTPAATPAKPAIVTLAQENTASKRVGESVSERVSSQVAQVPPLQTTKASIQNATVSAFAQANRELAGTGQCIEAPGSDAPQRWIHDGSIEEMNGGY
jgi:hypothetical protein